MTQKFRLPEGGHIDRDRPLTFQFNGRSYQGYAGDTLAAALAEQRDMLEEVIEPYLIQQGLIQRTPRGRMLSIEGYRHLGMTPSAAAAQQLDLLAGGGGDGDG